MYCRICLVYFCHDIWLICKELVMEFLPQHNKNTRMVFYIVFTCLMFTDTLYSSKLYIFFAKSCLVMVTTRNILIRILLLFFKHLSYFLSFIHAVTVQTNQTIHLWTTNTRFKCYMSSHNDYFIICRSIPFHILKFDFNYSDLCMIFYY